MCIIFINHYDPVELLFTEPCSRVWIPEPSPSLAVQAGFSQIFRNDCLGPGRVWTRGSNFRLDCWSAQMYASLNDQKKNTVQTQLRRVQTLDTISLSGPSQVQMPHSGARVRFG